MKNRNPTTQSRRKTVSIKTSVMELLEELTRLTKDDALVMATMKSIFASYQVRLINSLAPVRLVNGDRSAKAMRLHRGRKSSAWA